MPRNILVEADNALTSSMGRNLVQLQGAGIRTFGGIHANRINLTIHEIVAFLISSVLEGL